jgi:hypothetical protein
MSFGPKSGFLRHTQVRTGVFQSRWDCTEAHMNASSTLKSTESAQPTRLERDCRVWNTENRNIYFNDRYTGVQIKAAGHIE